MKKEEFELIPTISLEHGEGEVVGVYLPMEMAKKEEKKSERTDEELAKKLDEIFDKNSSVLRLPSGREINDNEAMHEDADLLLIKFLEQIGYTKTVEKYYEMKKYFRYS